MTFRIFTRRTAALWGVLWILAICIKVLVKDVVDSEFQRCWSAHHVFFTHIFRIQVNVSFLKGRQVVAEVWETESAQGARSIITSSALLRPPDSRALTGSSSWCSIGLDETGKVWRKTTADWSAWTNWYHSYCINLRSKNEPLSVFNKRRNKSAESIIVFFSWINICILMLFKQIVSSLVSSFA